MATVTFENPQSSRTTMLNVLLWAAQLFLAAVFFSAGIAMVSQPISDLATGMAWVADVPAALVRVIGVVELIGAAGLIFPALLRFWPSLTPAAAAGFTAMMLLAIFFHLARREPGGVLLTLILGNLAFFVAWGRAKRLPIAPSTRSTPALR